MRIVFFSYGTRGDAQPQVSLATGLKERGFEVRVAAPENLRGFVERAGIDYAPLYGSSQTILESEEGQRWLRSGNVNAFMKSIAAISKEIDPHVFKSGLEAAQGADAIVGGTLAEEMSVTIAEKLRLPFVFGHTIPFETTADFPCAMVTQSALPFGFLNRATYALFRKVAFPVHRDAINTWRKQLGLSPQTDTVVSRAAALGLPVVQLWSEHLVPHASDAPATVVTAGSVRVPASVRAKLGEGAPPAELVSWLASGPPPIFVGFGSMPMPSLEAFTADLSALADSLKGRFVVCGGWNDVSAFKANEKLHFVRSVDHTWLFPKCAAVVHHGGAGTTFAAAEAGVPSVICSFFADQPFWGSRIERLGVGAHVPFVKLNRATFGKALERVLSESSRRAASELGARLRAEDGNTRALDAIVRFVDSGARMLAA